MMENEINEKIERIIYVYNKTTIRDGSKRDETLCNYS